MTDRFLILIRQGWTASRIVALYALIGSAWILLSDRLIIFSAPDPATASLFSTIKGLGYVAATATLLHWLINRHTAELRESEERFRVIFEHANDAIHIDNADDKILDVNPRMCELMGYSRDELLTMRIPDLQVSEFRGAGRVVVTELARHGDALFEGLNLHRNGQRIPVEISVARVARPQGDLFVSVIRDITERKHAEEKLRQSEASLKFSQQVAHVGHWTWDTTTNQVIWSDEMYRVFGLDPETFDGDLDQIILRAIHPDDREKVIAANTAVLTEQRSAPMEYRVVRPDRVVRTIWAVPGARTVDATGHILKLSGIVQDITDRKRAEEALRESEARLLQIASTVQEVFWLRDTQTLEMLYVNPAYEMVWGRTCASLYTNPTSFVDAVHADDKERVMKAIAVQRQTGTSFNEEYRIIRPDNSLRWVRGQTFPIKNEAGQVYRIAASVLDITERKQAEEALRDSEAKFRAIVENSHDGILFSDANTTILYRSPSYQRINGYTDEERVGHAGFDTVHPNDLDRVRQYWAEILQHPEVAHKMEYRILHKDGTWRWLETSGQNLLGNPHVQAVVVTSRDITDRKQHEREIAAIAAVATALRAAATHAEMLPIIVQQTADLLKTDGTALILRDAATGQNVIAYGLGVGADSTGLRIPPGAGIVGHVIATGRPYLTQDAMHDPLTYRRDLMSELRAIGCAPLIAQQRIIGALWVGRSLTISEDEVRVLSTIGDITANALHRAEVLETLEQRVYDRTRELAEANERLTELDRLKSKFVSDVSHELRTPVTSLMLNVELLEHGKPEKREHYLQVIRQQTARQVQLIEDILNLSRLELSAARVQFAPVNINALVEQAVNVYRSSAEAANLELNFTPDPGQPVVLAVESHLSQVVTNLIANAINYTPAGSVEVATRLADREVVIEVRDTGLGIAAQDMPHLFDRFYRGKLTWQVRGSGLGLAIVKEITEVHKGRVEVDSQAGVGSTFRVYLPLA